MLRIIQSYKNIDPSALLSVYEQTVNQQMSNTDFLEDLSESLRNHSGSMYLWEHEGVAVSALRCEPYLDGCLIYDLETKPDCRRRGYGNTLIKNVLDHLAGSGVNHVYSHVHKKNKVSIYIHKRLGFTEQLEYAKMLDGSISWNYFTFAYKKDMAD